MNESSQLINKIILTTGGTRGLPSKTFSRSHHHQQQPCPIYKYCCSKTSFSPKMYFQRHYYSALFLLLKFSLIAATFFLHWTTVLPGTAAATRSHLWLASLGNTFKAWTRARTCASVQVSGSVAGGAPFGTGSAVFSVAV
uniref:Zuotin, putative n=1 Tax=Arundo donax TaxID=35708 RepID=A0A0A9E533_ARUDO